MKDKQFEKRNEEFIKLMARDKNLRKQSRKWFDDAFRYEYSYHFTWLGRSIIQFPQDIIAIQEIIWKIKPELIIETGIARGGSLILSASILEMIGKGEVLGIDIDMREHNKIEIEKHPLFKRITVIEGSSIDKNIVNRVYEYAKDKKRVLILLDSHHTEKHVLTELKLYSKLVTKGGYIIVFDTMIEDTLAEKAVKDRPWGKGNNPKIAVRKFLKSNNRFKIDKTIENKLLITSCPDGYLKCVK